MGGVDDNENDDDDAKRNLEQKKTQFCIFLEFCMEPVLLLLLRKNKNEKKEKKECVDNR